MGTDLLPRLKKMERLAIHYSAGGSDRIAGLLLFCGASGSALEAVRFNCGYVRKKDALLLADRLEGLRRRLRKQDARQVLERRALLSREELRSLVVSISRDIGNPDPAPSLTDEMVELMIDLDFELGPELRDLIRLCRKGGGFWWS